MRELCKCYDKKSCLNLKHSEVIIDVFRFCIRKDPDLSTYLEKRTVSRETFQSSESEAAHTNLDFTTIPNPSMMEVDTQSNLDMLFKRKLQLPSLKEPWIIYKEIAKIYCQNL